MSRIFRLKKRDGRVVPFDRGKLADAIYRASQAAGLDDRFLADELAGVVVLELERRGVAVPSAADVREEVERILVGIGQTKAAKAYVAYRERRAEALRRRVPEGAPVVHAPGGDRALPWSKARLAEELVRADGLDPAEAEEIARRVEERILRSDLDRIPRSTIVALVRAEMFDRGRRTRFGRTRTVGVPRLLVRRLLLGGGAGRVRGARGTVEESLGEEVLERFALEELLPVRVADAHRRGDLHLYDLGAPLRLTALALPGPELLARELGLAEFTRPTAPRRAGAAIAAIVAAHAGATARVLTIEALNALLAPWWGGLDEMALAEECRALLLSPAVRTLPGRGGLLRLEFGLVAEVPARFAGREVPNPVVPGRAWGDHVDAAIRIARALLRESHLLRREGVESVPDLSLHLRRDQPRDAAVRALVKQALAVAAELGEPRFVLEPPTGSLRGGRALRVEEGEVADPLRFDGGDLSVASVTAVNLHRALRPGSPVSSEAILAEADHLLDLALEAVAARRAMLERWAAHPSGGLYPVLRGPVPIVDFGSAFHLLQVVGLPTVAAGGAGLAGRALRRIQERAAEVTSGCPVGVVHAFSSQADERFRRLDPGRAEGVPADPRSAPSVLLRPRPGRGTPPLHRVVLRVDTENRPPPDRLHAALEEAERDPQAQEFVLDPWPRRVVRGRDPFPE